MTVTSASAPASAVAALSPPKPAPTMTMCGRTMAGLLKLRAGEQSKGDETVDRQCAGPAAQYIGEDRGPHQMLRPVLGIDQELNGERHEQERRSTQASEEAEHQQHRRRELDRRAHVGSDLRRPQRQAVFAP